MAHPHDDPHDQGLQADLELWMGQLDRRRALAIFATALAVVPMVGCSETVSEGGGTCDGTAIPEETAGPYPGDGSNGPNALVLSGIVRSDITESIAGGTGTAEGVALTIEIELLAADGCTPLEGYAVYLWHCDRDGDYSMYTAEAANYLRGVQETDADGRVSFTTIFPGCYSGRWPHVHFEVYPSLAEATSAGNKIATSQLALPESACSEVYDEAGYESSVSNLAAITLSSDNVFGDGSDQQLAATSGSVSEGYFAMLTVPIDA